MSDIAPRNTEPAESDGVAAEDEIESSRAPLLDHLVELRDRLIKTIAAIGVAMVVCFFFAGDIFNILIVPFERAVGDDQQLELIYTAPLEYFFTQMKLALFGGIFIAFPVIAGQAYMFIAPGLYRNEKKVFLPFLIATPVLFALGAALVYFFILPMAMKFALSFEQAGLGDEASIQLLARVSDYLSLVMTLILAFGLAFQLPVLLTLLARVGFLSSQSLQKNRKYAIVGIFAFAAFVTPPDPLSQIGLGIAVIALYEISVFAVRFIERGRDAEEAEDEAAPST